MAFIPAAGVGRVAVEATTVLGSVANVLHFKQPAGATVFDMAALAQAVWDAWVANVMQHLSIHYTLVSVRATDLTAVDAPVASYSGAGTPSGAITGEASPFGSAAVVTLRTAARGRSGRGRVYLGPLAESDVAQGQISSVRESGIVTAMEDFRTDVGSIGWNLGVLSLHTAGAPRTEGLWRPVVDILMRSPLVGSQDRRQGRP